MERLLQGVKIKINDKLYVKDPESSELGKNIIEHSILLINKLGWENFTFKKLGKAIGSNESSIYRYFENKHKLLIYLTSWYWGWMEYHLVFATHSIQNPKEKLIKGISILTSEVKIDASFSHINEVILNEIVINEYSKSYLTKEVDNENKEGYFTVYKRMVSRIGEMIKGVNASYKFPSSLASTLLESALHQHYLKDHFSTLTDCNDKVAITEYLTHLVFNTLNTPINE